MKPELLCPCGNTESLKAAIHAGADAVYLAGKNFGARMYAENFSLIELKEAINYAHIYNVKVYITANTLIFEEEVKPFIDYVSKLYSLGVDALIMQDIGMITLVRKLFPDLEIHASTQGNNCNDETLKLYKDLGVTRVVLARELDIDTINSFKTNIEKEVFIHGALCISYSGCCLFSSLNGGRSGNRGKCAASCRLPYTLIKDGKTLTTDGKYLLSTKELNTTKYIDKLLNSNIQSLKIEGRMKSPEYVGFVTKIYRNLIDKKEYKNYEKDLKKLFNREFTSGYLFNDRDIMNTKSPNHQGIVIGKVIETGKYIKIKLSDTLNQNDGIRFKESGKGMIVNRLYNKKLLLTKSANDICYLDNKIGLKTNDTILKTFDYELMQILKKYDLKKILVNFNVKALKNKPLEITISDNKYKITMAGNTVEAAIKVPVTKEDIIKGLSKLGNTPFSVNNINIEMNNDIFISLKEINEIRRKLVLKLIGQKTHIEKRNINYNIPVYSKSNSKKSTISAYVRTEEQLKALINKIDYIYTDNFDLYQKYKCNKIFYIVSRTLTELPNYNNENLLIGCLGSLKYTRNNNCFGNYYYNVTNSHSVNFLKDMGLKHITISPELDFNHIKSISNKENLEVIIYGTLELMIINRKLVPTNGYSLKNNLDNYFPIIIKDNQTHIMHHSKINNINLINDYKKIGINNFRLEFFNETKEEIIKILEQDYLKDLSNNA